MNEYLEKIVKRSPNLNSPLEAALGALWILDNDDETKESDTANEAACALLELQSEAKWADEYFRNWQSAQHRLHLTAFGVGTLAFLAGFCICWLAFVR